MLPGTGSVNFLTWEALSWNIALLKDYQVSTTADTPFPPSVPFLMPFLDVRPQWLLVSHWFVTIPMFFPHYKEWPGQLHHWPPALPAGSVTERDYSVFLSGAVWGNWPGPKKLLRHFFGVGGVSECLFNCVLTMNPTLYCQHHTLLHLFLTTVRKADTGLLASLSRCKTGGPESSESGRAGLESQPPPLRSSRFKPAQDLFYHLNFTPNPSPKLITVPSISFLERAGSEKEKKKCK